jgi:hypothetical protein
MEPREIQKFLHDLNNFLNSANINTSLLRRMHEGTLDQDAMRRLEAALRDAEKITREFQQRALGDTAKVRDPEFRAERSAP